MSFYSSLLLIIYCKVLICSSSSSLDSPKINLYKYDQHQGLNFTQNSEIILQANKSEGLLLECSAPYSIQWIYSGNGMPQFMTNATDKWRSGEINGGSESVEKGYRGYLYMKQLKETYTGSYACISGSNTELLSYYFIYISGNDLFVNTKGKTIYYNSMKKDETITIPCSVSNPDIITTLQKSNENNNLEKIPENAYKYDSKMGFDLKTSLLTTEINGTYLCTASHKNIFRVVEYKVLPRPKIECSPECGENAECVKQPPLLRGLKAKNVCQCITQFEGDPYKKCRLVCDNNPDCPSHLICSLKRSCEDPCETFCDPGEECKVIDHKVSCSRKHIVQKPLIAEIPKRMPIKETGPFSDTSCSPNPCQGLYTECKLTRGKVNCTCSRGYLRDLLNKDNCMPQCISNSDCPHNQICETSRSYPKCIDPCAGFCGHRALCRLERREPTCFCPDGYTGDPEKICIVHNDYNDNPPQKQNGMKLQESLPPLPGLRPPSSMDRVDNYCSNCGMNAHCKEFNGFYKCECDPMYVGHPPDCRRMNMCEFTNSDLNFNCKEDEICRDGRCLPRYPPNHPNGPADRDLCKRCAPNARCEFLRNSLSVSCECPYGWTGNPFITCYEIELHLTNTNWERADEVIQDNLNRAEEMIREQMQSLNLSPPQDKSSFGGNSGGYDSNSPICKSVLGRRICKDVPHETPQCLMDNDCRSNFICDIGTCVLAVVQKKNWPINYYG